MRAADIADERRRAANAKHAAAIDTINMLFDRADQLRIARDRLTGIEPASFDADPIRSAQAVIDTAHRLEEALSELRRAAERAAAHRSRADLASDIGTHQSALFPRKPTTASRPHATTTPAPAASDDHVREVS